MGIYNINYKYNNESINVKIIAKSLTHAKEQFDEINKIYGSAFTLIRSNKV